MSVLYLIQGADVSGAERMHAELIREDPEALVCCPPDSATERFARDLGAAVEPWRFRALRHSGGLIEGVRSVFRGIAAAMELRRILKRHPERSLLFCTSIRPGMVASLAAAGLGRRLLWCAPDFLPPAPLSWIVRLMVRRSAGRVLCLSGAIADDLCGSSKRLRTLATVVHPGVELDRFRPATETVPQPIAAVVGHVSQVKRTDLAVDVAELVAGEIPDFRLRVIGTAQFRDEDFTLERELRERVAANPRLDASVEFRGFADLSEALGAGCRFLLHCRPDEPFGIVLIEAMAMGIVVVAPAAAGPVEIVEDGVTGVLYEPLDVAGAATALHELIADPDRTRRMGIAARQRVERDFDIRRQLAETRRLMSEVAGPS